MLSDKLYVFNKPKEWSHDQWVTLICLLDTFYPLDAGQIGKDEYQIIVHVKDDKLKNRIKNLMMGR